MSAQPRQSRKTASPDKGEAASAERNAKPKTLAWRDLKLTLPAAMPTMQLIGTWRRLSKAAADEDGQATMNYLADLVNIVVGGDERQADLVLAKIDADAKGGDDAAAAVFELVDTATVLYGVDSGE